MTASIAIVMLHPGCNMTCTFCITENGFSSMTFDQAVCLLEELKERSISSVIFGGGEPFTWRHDLLALCRLAGEMGFFVQVGTNGIALPNGFESISSINRYVLPLESVDRTVHNQARLYKNRHQEIILERLDRLREAGKSVTISTVVTRETLSGLEALGQFLQQYKKQGGNLHAWHLYKFIPEGRGGSVHANLGLDETAYDQACDTLKNSNLGFTIFKRKNMLRSRTVDFFWQEGNQLKGGYLCQPRLSPIFLERIMTGSMPCSATFSA